MQRHYINIDSPEQLSLQTDEAPRPRPGEVLIEVHFAGVNRADVLQRLGLYPVPEDASPILGLEVSGLVVALGDGVEDLRVGDQVCALVHGGGYASHAIARVDHCLAVPRTVSLEQAAALPEALLTVWHNVFALGKLTASETLLVHGGGSGIGSIAVQMAKAVGARVVATAGGSDKCRRVGELGADHVIDYQQGALLEQLQNLGIAGQLNVVLDMAGGDFTGINLQVAAPDGRVVVIGMMRGLTAEIDLFQILMKRLTLTGSTLRGMGAAGRAAGFAEIRAKILPFVESGAIRPIVHQVLPLEKAMEAHRLMESGTHFGKILLSRASSEC